MYFINTENKANVDKTISLVFKNFMKIGDEKYFFSLKFFIQVSVFAKSVEKSTQLPVIKY